MDYSADGPIDHLSIWTNLVQLPHLLDNEILFLNISKHMYGFWQSWALWLTKSWNSEPEAGAHLPVSTLKYVRN